MRRHFKRKVETEFELDLAPLLAVMVKLVPVLLLTTSFVQYAALDTQLPSSGSANVEPSQTYTMALKSAATGFSLTVDNGGQSVEKLQVANIAEAQTQIKALVTKYPTIKTFFLSPSSANSYEEMTTLLELSPVKEVVLANVFEEQR